MTKPMPKPAVVLLLLIVSFWVPSQASAIPILSFEPLAQTLFVGDTLTVNVRLDGATSADDIIGFQFDVLFDPAILAAVSATEAAGAVIESGGIAFFPGIIDNTTGSISSVANVLLFPAPPVSTDGLLVSLTFAVLGIGISPLTITNSLLVNESFESVVHTTVEGSVNGLPEPGTSLLLAVGLAGSEIMRRRSRKRRLRP